MEEIEEVAQSKEQRKESIAIARSNHHNKKINTKKRVDAYVDPETKEGLKKIKKEYNLKNEGEAIDKAIELALKS